MALLQCGPASVSYGVTCPQTLSCIPIHPLWLATSPWTVLPEAVSLPWQCSWLSVWLLPHSSHRQALSSPPFLATQGLSHPQSSLSCTLWEESAVTSSWVQVVRKFRIHFSSPKYWGRYLPHGGLKLERKNDPWWCPWPLLAPCVLSIESVDGSFQTPQLQFTGYEITLDNISLKTHIKKN